MARKFETTAITSTVKAPISKRSLTHINTAWDDLSEDIIKGLLGTYTTNDVIVLYGCVVTANIPGTSEVTAGAIFYNGRIYKVDANASISTPSNTLVWSIIESTITGDPATFSDGSSEDFHIIEKFRLTNAATGTGLSDYDAATVKKISTIQRGDWVNATMQNSWTVGGGGVVRYKKDIFGNVSIQCTAVAPNGTDNVTIFTLPSGYRPEVQISHQGLIDQGGGTYIRHELTINTNGTVALNFIDAGGTGDVLRFFVNFPVLP